ncbi:hypothetical protein H8E88_20560 [candidate division KSB1 bacterium]|nr:hypothetical protein [candidate division KSB1 bacterium]MBL7092887.1 hypothetical protein [candidate division KSB1 bacterium]
MIPAIPTFDKLSYVKKLIAVGFTDQQAEVQAAALAEIVNERLKAKQNLNILEATLKKELKELEIASQKDIKNMEAVQKQDLKNMEMAAQKDIKNLELTTQ